MSATRRLANITLDNLDDLSSQCRRCVFWELDPVAKERADASGDPGLEKEAWVSAALLEWGSCGKICYLNDLPVAYIYYAPPAYVPRSFAFPTSPVSGDAALLMTGFVLPEFGEGGLGRILVQAVAKDLLKRGIKAVEAFGDAQWEKPACILPADFLLSVGFKTVRPHPRYPRLRLELRSTVTWKEDVEAALERLLGSVSPEGAFRPV